MLDVTISSVNLSKTFVNIQPFVITSDTSKLLDPDAYVVMGRLTSATNLRLHQSLPYSETKVSWEVIEYV